jgi:2-keto-4-pentenoate hydratase/2-oxohepta-3-ene-1,7-dioic acid hydratase in catechol pathway
MRYVTYRANDTVRVGYLEGDVVIDVGFDGDMVAFIEADAPHGKLRTVPNATLAAPLRPRSMRDFLQFEGHLNNALTRLGREIPGEFFTTPAYYKGMPDTVIGPEVEIPWPSYTDRLDHELELAAVIGRPGRDITPQNALAHVFGWTIWNDMSARDTQVSELPLGLGPGKAKDWDGSNVLGPCIVTPDEIDGLNLEMSVSVNGEEWGRETTANMHFSFLDLIAYASQAQLLHPGDVLGSGTFTGGSGLELDRRLAPGDVIEMTAAGLGTLRNTIGRKH